MAKQSDLERRLKELDGLRDRGVITEHEYQARRTTLPREPSSIPIIAGIGIVLLVIVGVISAVVSSGGDDEAQAPTRASGSAQATSASHAAIGEPLRLEEDGWLITVTGTRTSPTIKGVTGEKTALGIYLIVDVTMENIEKTARELGGDRFVIRDSQGREYKFFSDGTIGNGRGEISSKINPGLTGRGTLVYDVPKDATSLVLETVGKGRIALGDLPATGQ